jgi:hypothetical protein
MPSESTIRQALDALSAPRERFRSAVAAAVDEVGAFLEARRAPVNGRAARTAHELGPFASGRLDPNRFASFFGESGTMDPLALARVERAHETLRATVERGDDAFVLRAAPGADLRSEVDQALAGLGRAFGAARAVEMARLGRLPTDEHEGYLDGFAFRRWNRAERQIAPPLVVEVHGADLQAGGLAEFLDGAQKLVLVVRGDAPPAALVRLVTPGVLVIQTSDAADLAILAGAAGPAALALCGEGAARFVHAPGEAPVWERITLHGAPEEAPRAALGAFSAFQQGEELKLLRALATAPPAPPEVEAPPAAAPEAASQAPKPAAAPEALAAAAAGATPDPVDRLAAWLLSQSEPGAS